MAKSEAMRLSILALLAWLALPPAERPRLATLYFDLVDDAGHRFGPLAPETAAAVKEADDALARLLAGLDRLGLRTGASLVIVSDHGMSEVSPERNASGRSCSKPE